MGKPNNIFPGHRVGRVTVIYELIERVGNGRGFLCQCECGEACVRTAASLNKGFISCGCYNGELSSIRNRTHGYSNDRASRIYRIWTNMKVRCTKPNAPDYSRYGGRGIQLCERWLKFENFLEDMGLPPSKHHTLDRIDTNGNYEPLNCKWSTGTEQCRNKRNNRRLFHRGELLTIAEWAERQGIGQDTLAKRIDKYGWSIENAIERPLTPTGQRNNFKN